MEFKTQDELKELYSGISASSMNYFDVSPRYFKDKIDRIIVDKPTPESILGNQTHEYILEPEKFKEKYIQLSIDKPKGKNQEEFCKVCAALKTANPEHKAIDIAPKAYNQIYTTRGKSEDKIRELSVALYEKLYNYITYLTIQTSDKEVVSDSNMRYLIKVKNVINSHKKAKELLFSEGNNIFDIGNIETFNEKRILWKYPNITLKDNKPIVCKSFVDRFTIDHDKQVIKLIDFKTTNKLHELRVDKIKERKYHRQLAFYWMSIHYFFKEQYKDKDIGEYSKETYIVGVQTPNHFQEFSTECRVIQISEGTLLEGFNDIENIINEIAWHIDNDIWDYSRYHNEHNGIDLII